MKKCMLFIVASAMLLAGCQNANNANNAGTEGDESQAVATANLQQFDYYLGVDGPAAADQNTIPSSMDATLAFTCNSETGAAIAIFRGDTISLQLTKGASGNTFTNGDYTLTQWQGTTTLQKGDQNLFLSLPMNVKGKLMVEDVTYFIPQDEETMYQIQNIMPEPKKAITDALAGATTGKGVLSVTLRVVPKTTADGNAPMGYTGIYDILSVDQLEVLSEE